MARFLNHTSCPRCGSSDALAEYDDGSSFCFSCRTIGGYRLQRRESVQSKASSGRLLPDDCSTVIGGEGLLWVSKYGLSPEQLITNNVLWSPGRRQVIFTFPPTDLWQARNFGDTKLKYFTSGNHDNILPIYSQSKADALVLVEDCLSGIKCSYLGCDSMPLLGSSLSTNKLARLPRFYHELVVWLDHDKGQEAQKIARRASLLGMRTRVIHTELDPKEYSNEEIKCLLGDGQ